MHAPRPLRLLAVLLLPVALLGAACSGDDDDSGDDPTIQTDSGDDGATDDTAAEDEAIDPCALLTSAELEQEFGSPFDAGEAVHQDETGADQCTWTNTDAPPVKTFSAVVYTDDGLQEAFQQSASSYYDLIASAATSDEELDIGDGAFRSGSIVNVLDGDRIYVFSTFLGDSEVAIDGLEALAELAVDGR